MKEDDDDADDNESNKEKWREEMGQVPKMWMIQSSFPFSMEFRVFNFHQNETKWINKWMMDLDIRSLNVETENEDHF